MRHSSVTPHSTPNTAQSDAVAAPAPLSLHHVLLTPNAPDSLTEPVNPHPHTHWCTCQSPKTCRSAFTAAEIRLGHNHKHPFTHRTCKRKAKQHRSGVEGVGEKWTVISMSTCRFLKRFGLICLTPGHL